MRFLCFWLISTLLSFGFLVIWGTAILNEMKREYKMPKFPKRSLSENIMNLICFAIPYINIIMVLVFIFGGETLKDKVKNTLIEKYNIKKLTDVE